MINAFFVWLKDNRDGVLALAALISPATVMLSVFVAAIVSYRAVVTGPRIQREIAQKQFELNNRQIELQERTFALSSRQLRARVQTQSDHQIMTAANATELASGLRPHRDWRKWPGPSPAKNRGFSLFTW
jgi:hypothetical protein